MIRAILVAMIAAAPAAAQPAMRDADRVRLAEAFALADAVADSIWAGWGEVPFVVLLLTPETEFLVGHPYPSEDFWPAGYDSILGANVHHRPYSGRYPLNFLATFPAIQGVNTVVIGQPENTGKSSTMWVLTALHEHFHQLQYTRPGYYDRVSAPDLAGGDETGMWQINYPFPYESPAVQERFTAYTAALQAALAAMGTPDGAGRLEEHHDARSALRASVSEADWRYLQFQFWQEGVARQTEHAIAEAAIRLHTPTPAFTALDDFIPYDAALDALDHQLAEEMAGLDLASWKRVVVYPVGAIEAKLLDRALPAWRERYHDEPSLPDRFYEPH